MRANFLQSLPRVLLGGRQPKLVTLRLSMIARGVEPLLPLSAKVDPLLPLGAPHGEARPGKVKFDVTGVSHFQNRKLTLRLVGRGKCSSSVLLSS